MIEAFRACVIEEQCTPICLFITETLLTRASVITAKAVIQRLKKCEQLIRFKLFYVLLKIEAMDVKKNLLNN